jgi:hypothetical protein
VHDSLVHGLGADHADAAHPSGVIVRHDVLALDRMDQWGFDPVREGAQDIGRPAASAAAHDHHTVRLLDPTGNFGDILVARSEFLTGLQGCHAGEATFRLGRDDILWERQVGDATPRVGGCDRLVNDARCLLRGRDGFRIERNIAEKQVGLGRLDEVHPLHLAGHVTGERQHGGMVAGSFIEAGNQMRAAGARGAGTHRKAAGELGLAGGGQRRPFLMTNAEPFDMTSSDRVGKWIQRVADQSEYLLDPDLLEHADQDVRNRLRHCRSCRHRLRLAAKLSALEPRTRD